MAKPAAFFPDEVWDGSSPSRPSPVQIVDKAPDYKDWDQITAEMVAVQNELTSPSIIGNTPLVYQINVPDVSAEINVTMSHRFQVTGVTVIKINANGGAGDTITVQNVDTAITNDIDMHVNDKIIVQASTIDDASHQITEGSVLRVVAVKATNVACIVYVQGIRV